MKQKHYINCHTHIFTKYHIPKHLGRTMLPWPFWKINIKWLIELLNILEYGSSYNKLRRKAMEFRRKANHLAYFIWPIKIISGALYVALFVLILAFLGNMFFAEKYSFIEKGYAFLKANLPAFLFTNFVQSILIIAGLFFFKSFRNLAKFLFKQLKVLPGPVTTEFLQKMVKMGEYANYDKQIHVLDKLMDQYPPGTRFVVLPMDMEYMAAGPPTVPYLTQLIKLEEIAKKSYYKDKIIPFIFADPRRIGEPCSNHLQEIKDHLNGTFKGIKIYPALGYYPFDKHLLDLWLFACEREIPIMTHCIKGTIFYRGRKKKEWNEHPILQEKVDGELENLSLNSLINYDFSTHFTHPLNFECLLNPKYLARVLLYHNDEHLNQLFGFDPSQPDREPAKNLSKLKICLAHYGGSDEWNKHLNLAKSDFDNRPIENNQFKTFDLKDGNASQLWISASWYSLISNMMAKYENVYTDISYLLHDNRNYSLLRHTLGIDNLRKKVLFGSDYYMVRQKESDKQTWIELKTNLTEAELDQIALINAKAYLGEGY